MYKLIAIDLDGTLLDDDKKIPQENIDTIHELIERGYEVVIATGRRYWSAKELTKDIKDPMIILANNGNIIRNSENDQVMVTKYLDYEDFKIIMKEGKKRGLYPIIHVDEYENGYDLVIELEKESENYFDYLSNDEVRYRQVEDYLEMTDDKILVIVYAGSKAVMDEFNNHILDNYPEKYNLHVMENLQKVEAILEVMNPLGNKWLSLVEYAKTKGIDSKEIIAIGDDNNDMEMVENSGLGIAMKNGIDMIKSVADIITEKDNNEGGVGLELKKVLNL